MSGTVLPRGQVRGVEPLNKQRRLVTSSAIETSLVLYGLVVAVAVSVANDLWHFLPELWELPLILFVLFPILRWVEQLRTDLGLSKDTVAQLNLEMTATKRSLETLALELQDAKGGAKVRHFDASSTFYRALSEAVESANKYVSATYERLTPPEDEPARDQYFKTVMNWVSESPGDRHLSRIIRVPEGTVPMREYAQRQLELASRTRGYEVRILTGSFGSGDSRSFVVVDDHSVFLAFFMQNPPSFRGSCITSEAMAADYRAHFNDLWNSATTECPKKSDKKRRNRK